MNQPVVENRVALITGGSRGIGLGIALALAREGLRIAINGIRPVEEVNEVLLKLHEAGSEAIYCQGNIGMAADRVEMLDHILQHFGRLDVLVNNAGVAPRERRDILDVSEDDFDYVMDINLKGTFFLSQLVAKHMLQMEEPLPSLRCIVNISSISATVASINRPQYCLSKSGMGMLTQLLAVRLGPANIPVYEVRPGIIRTDMTAGVTAKYDALFQDGLGITQRWGTPEDVGKAVAALVRGDFPYSTGQVLMVDGGLTTQKL